MSTKLDKDKLSSQGYQSSVDNDLLFGVGLPQLSLLEFSVNKNIKRAPSLSSSPPPSRTFRNPVILWISYLCKCKWYWEVCKSLFITFRKILLGTNILFHSLTSSKDHWQNFQISFGFIYLDSEYRCSQYESIEFKSETFVPVPFECSNYRESSSIWSK